jgi:hypothetical protein
MKAIIEDGRCFVPLKSVAMFVAAFWFLVIAKPLKPGHQMTLRSSQRFTERSRAQLSGASSVGIHHGQFFTRGPTASWPKSGCPISEGVRKSF